jgi:FlaA1/EpsC-like NDP-sugar epimerase
MLECLNQNNPSLLLLLDHSEFNLYQIDQELKVTANANNHLIVPLLVDIKDYQSLERIFEEHAPELVFHAAAYKHVHLVEQNPCSSILNNVQGTKNLVDLSENFQVENFVLISTDKAVNPAGIMGMTKRLCELMVAEAGARLNKHYCAVRFGNVLGSSGSLIPLLKSQIEKGEPLTITHHDMTRYFMLISEAVSLVLKAASITQPGDISILRMGDPVKIVDIAKSLIALMGRSPEQVPIIFTGLRPGEKMFEELYLCGNELKTEDPDILILPKGDGVTHSSVPLDQILGQILESAQNGNTQAVYLLRSFINSNYRVPLETANWLTESLPNSPNPSFTPRLWQ